MAALHAALHQRVARLALLEPVVDVATPHAPGEHSHHHRAGQLDQADQQGAVRRTAQVIAHSAQQRLRECDDVDTLLRLSLQTSAHVVLLEVPLPDRAGHRHDADGVDESRGPEEHEEVPETQHHVRRRVFHDGARDERAVGHRLSVLADHRRVVLGCASAPPLALTHHRADVAKHFVGVVRQCQGGGEGQGVHPCKEAEQQKVHNGDDHRHASVQTALEASQQNGGRVTDHDSGLLHLLHGHVHRVAHGDHHKPQHQRDGRHDVRRDLPVDDGALVGGQVVGQLRLSTPRLQHLLDDVLEGEVAPVEELVAGGHEEVEPLTHGQQLGLLEAEQRYQHAEQQTQDDGAPHDELRAGLQQQLGSHAAAVLTRKTKPRTKETIAPTARIR